jgi:hypothetical protein
MSDDSNHNCDGVVSTRKVVLTILAAVVLALIAGVLIYARDYSGNDTSAAVTNAPPARP